MGFKQRSLPSSDVAMVRQRPGMYIGDTDDGSGLHHMLWEVVANSLDEHLAGHGEEINIAIHADGAFSVEDQGRGISVADDNGAPYVERVCRELHVTATRDGHAPHIHVNLHGVGLAAVAALSDAFQIDVHRDGGHFRQRLARGVLIEPLSRVGDTTRTGTTVRSRPDPTVFSTTAFSYERIKDRLDELAALSRSVRFNLCDERPYRDAVYHPEGISALVAMERYRGDSVHGPALLPQPIVIEQQTPTCRVEAAITWRRGASEVESFVNLQRTRGGGRHVDGLLAGVRDGWRRAAGTSPGRARGAERGLHAAIHVLITDGLKYGNPTKDRLDQPDVTRDVRAVVREAVSGFFLANPQLARRLLER